MCVCEHSSLERYSVKLDNLSIVNSVSEFRLQELFYVALESSRQISRHDGAGISHIIF